MNVQEISIVVDEGARSQAVSISSTSAQSAVIKTEDVIATPTVDVFVRQGANPTALSDGTDILLLASTTYRLAVKPGNKLAFKTSSATGTVYLTPGA
jgi:hypothetical protein